MKNMIYGLLILIALLMAGCVKEKIQERGEGKLTDIGCDAVKPCSKGYECIKLPEKNTPVCVTPDVLQNPKYKDCVVLESYPAQLRCPKEEPAIRGCEKDSDCKISGCNREICAKEEMMSVCIYKPEFECYKLTRCECHDGKCGWEQTEEFLECLASNK